MHSSIYYAFALCLFFSCSHKEEPNNIPHTVVLDEKAQMIIDAAIAKHGQGHYDKSLVTFNFRGRRYEAARRGGKFEYKRQFQDSIGRFINDVLDNNGLKRYMDGKEVELLDNNRKAYANSVNSVIYFALLPYFLNDAAAKKTYLGEENIQDLTYHKIKVTFNEEGGGKDFEDEFVYWFQKDSLTMDYLAYNYLTDGGGARFRSAYNSRTIAGIRFSDYINWKPKEKDRRDVEHFGQLFNTKQLKELSKIENENIEVIHLK